MGKRQNCNNLRFLKKRVGVSLLVAGLFFLNAGLEVALEKLSEKLSELFGRQKTSDIKEQDPAALVGTYLQVVQVTSCSEGRHSQKEGEEQEEEGKAWMMKGGRREGKKGATWEKEGRREVDGLEKKRETTIRRRVRLPWVLFPASLSHPFLPSFLPCLPLPASPHTLVSVAPRRQPAETMMA